MSNDCASISNQHLWYPSLILIVLFVQAGPVREGSHLLCWSRVYKVRGRHSLSIILLTRWAIQPPCLALFYCNITCLLCRRSMLLDVKKVPSHQWRDLGPGSVITRGTKVFLTLYILHIGHIGQNMHIHCIYIFCPQLMITANIKFSIFFRREFR